MVKSSVLAFLAFSLFAASCGANQKSADGLTIEPLDSTRATDFCKKVGEEFEKTSVAPAKK